MGVKEPVERLAKVSSDKDFLFFFYRVLTYEYISAVDFDVVNITNLCRYTIALHILMPWKALQPNLSLAINVLIHKIKICLVKFLIQRLYDNLLLWILVTAGVGAYGLLEREWFVGYLARIVDNTGITDWDDIKWRLQSVIWNERLNARTHKML